MIDAGANVGEFVLPFFQRYGGEAICIEPYPPAAAVLREKCPPGVEVIEAALWTNDGEATLRTYSRNWDTNTLFDKQKTTPDGSTKVKTITLDSLLSRWGWVDLLKLDIEGAEFDVLRQSKILGERVGQIAAELHYFNYLDESFRPPSRQKMR